MSKRNDQDAAPVASANAPEATAPAPTVDLNDKAYYIHRELSQLQFNNRVLEQALDERIKTREPPSPDKSPDRDASKVSSQMDAKESEIISEALAAIFDSDTSGFLLGSTLLQEVRIAASVPNSTFRVVDAEKKANVFYLHTQHRFPTSNGESIYWEREFICIGLDKATVIISISIPSGADHRSRDGSWVNSWLASLRVPLE